MTEQPRPQAAALAFVHHANQYLITDTYDNRQGIQELVEGYAATLRLHEKYHFPANLHLSGTLIEAIAWYCPWFLDLVREFRRKGLVALIGGTYAENVMTPFSRVFNHRQLNEHLWLYAQHLDCQPNDVRLCWIPERVWDGPSLIPVLTDGQLLNGGYDFVLLDDRLLYPTSGSYPTSPRAHFDAAGPYAQYERVDGTYTLRSEGLTDEFAPIHVWKSYRIAEANGLGVVPISANLRYWIPPHFSHHWGYLDETIKAFCQYGTNDSLLVYADDLEKTAGVGGWDSGALERYARFLSWMSERTDVVPVLLPDWLQRHSPQTERVVETGTFFELAQDWQAGEDYRGWWQGAAWIPYQRYLKTAQTALESAEAEGADPLLLKLGWKHLLASSYETAWHDASPVGHVPAPWAKAVASHARTCLTIADAARWFARSERFPMVKRVDIDEDGEDEILICNENLYAVLAPHQGGRVIALFTLTIGGAVMVIGNPSDDWNFQQELNRYMDWPPNHPGALADVGSEHDQYQIADERATSGFAFVEMINEQAGSLYQGLRKTIFLPADGSALVVCYRLPSGLAHGITTELCLSPDYYRLLREGRRSLRPYQGPSWQGTINGEVAVWAGIPQDEESEWVMPTRMEVGHGLNFRIQTHADHAHIVIGCDQTDQAQFQHLIEQGRNALHSVALIADLVDVSTSLPKGGNGHMDRKVGVPSSTIDIGLPS